MCIPSLPSRLQRDCDFTLKIAFKAELLKLHCGFNLMPQIDNET